MSQETQTSSASKTSNQSELLEQRWNDIRSQLKSQWHELTDEDLKMIDGDSRKLVAMVSQKTHQPIHEIEQAIDRIASESGGLLSRLTQQVSQYADYAARSISQPAARAYHQAEQLVSGNPTCSVATAFGVGMLVGILTYALASDE